MSSQSFPTTRKEIEELLLSLISSVEQNDSAERKALAKITGGFGGLPLALNLMVDFMSAVACSYDTFLQNYPQPEREFLFGSSVNHLGSQQVYQKSVGTIWTLGLQNTNLNANTHGNLLRNRPRFGCGS